MLDVVVTRPFIYHLVIFADFQIPNSNCLISDENEGGVPCNLKRWLPGPLILGVEARPSFLGEVGADELLLRQFNAGAPDSFNGNMPKNRIVQELGQFLVGYHFFNLYLENVAEFPRVAFPFSDENIVRTSFKRLIQLVRVLRCLDVEFLIVPQSMLVHQAVLAVIGLLFANRTEIVVLCVS